MIEIKVNGISSTLKSDTDTPLLWALRDELKQTGTKFGCGVALCGACSVHIDGEIARSCMRSISTLNGKSITTIEANSDVVINTIKDAWIALDVSQCGYCQPGQIMTAAALLKTNKSPSPEQIDSALSGNLCRCGSYARIREAVLVAAKELRVR